MADTDYCGRQADNKILFKQSEQLDQCEIMFFKC